MSKAWRTEVRGFRRGIVSAETRAKAVASVLSGVHDAGYKNYTWPMIRCTRAPEFDGWANEVAPGTHWVEELMKNNA
jgi:hypothetical protein